MLRQTNMLRWTTGRSLRLLRGAQSFSSSPDAQPPGSNFYRKISQFVRRVVDRNDQFRRYQEHSVFPPSNWDIHNYYLYAKLQLPSKTEVDAAEFLNGARFACDRVIHAMHSKELIAFATGNAKRPQIADEMEQMLDPTCYRGQFLPRVRQLGAGISSVELKELDFSGVYLSGVKFKRATRATLKKKEMFRAVVGKKLVEMMAMDKINMQQNAREMASNLMAATRKMKIEALEEDGSEILEKMQLSALFHSTQTVEAVVAKTSKQVTVKTDVKTALCFESLVTEPDDVDWRIVKMKRSRHIVSRTTQN